MTTIEIPLPELRIEETVTYPEGPWTGNSVNVVVLRLVFGGYPITERTYETTVYDNDDYELNECRDRFRAYVADRMSRLFVINLP